MNSLDRWLPCQFSSLHRQGAQYPLRNYGYRNPSIKLIKTDLLMLSFAFPNCAGAQILFVAGVRYERIVRAQKRKPKIEPELPLALLDLVFP